jgi:hypothetical protein
VLYINFLLIIGTVVPSKFSTAVPGPVYGRSGTVTKFSTRVPRVLNLEILNLVPVLKYFEYCRFKY